MEAGSRLSTPLNFWGSAAKIPQGIIARGGEETVAGFLLHFQRHPWCVNAPVKLGSA